MKSIIFSMYKLNDDEFDFKKFINRVEMLMKNADQYETVENLTFFDVLFKK